MTPQDGRGKLPRDKRINTIQRTGLEQIANPTKREEIKGTKSWGGICALVLQQVNRPALHFAGGTLVDPRQKISWCSDADVQIYRSFSFLPFPHDNGTKAHLVHSFSGFNSFFCFMKLCCTLAQVLDMLMLRLLVFLPYLTIRPEQTARVVEN